MFFSEKVKIACSNSFRARYLSLNLLSETNWAADGKIKLTYGILR